MVFPWKAGFGAGGSLVAGVGEDFSAVDGDGAELEQLEFAGQLEGFEEAFGEERAVLPAKGAEGVVVGIGVGAEEAHGDILPGGALDAAGDEEAGGIAINEQAEHHGGRVLGVAGAAAVDLDVVEGKGGDGVDHEMGKVVIGHLVTEIRGQQQRHVRESLSEEELVVFDILTRPAPELSEDERTAVKKVARELLERLKQLLVINWRQKSAARATMKVAIEDVLDTGLPTKYSKELYGAKCAAVFEHFYEGYSDLGKGVYAEAG